MAKKIKRAKNQSAREVASSSETPLCIRFKPGDLDRVRDAAARDGVLRSVWIREAALERAEQISGGMEVEALFYETAGGVGDQVCIRFRPRDFERIQHAAAREKTLPSPWIRAVVMHRVNQSLPEAVRSLSKVNKQKLTPRKSAIRPRIKEVTATKRAAGAH